jgi:putative peptidoglycan lipid II flippase
VGQEVRATAEDDDLIAVPPPDEAEVVDLPAEDSREAYVRNTAVMSVGTALSRLTGFLRLSAQTAALGVTVSALGNTYATANTTPNIVYELVLGGILTSVFVPVFVAWKQRHGRDEAWAVADRVLTLALVVLSLVAVAGAILAPQIIRLYLSASDAPDKDQQIALGAYFLRWFMPQIVFYGIGAVATGLLNSERRFAVPMFAPILNNLVVIATFGVYAWTLHGGTPSVEDITDAQRLVLAAGTTLGVVAMTVALWPSLRRLGFRWHLRFDWNHAAVRRLGRLAAWVVVYVLANQVAYVIIIVLNGRFDAGYQIYSTAFILFSLPHAIFVVSIFTALLPGMSDRWSAGDPAGVRTLFSRGIRDTVVIIVPASLGYVALALPIVRMLLEHGQALPTDAEQIARTLQAFALGLPFFSAFQLMTRTFYAVQDTRTPALVNLAAAAVNIGADLVMISVFDLSVPGLALGHAISYAFATLACALLLRRRLVSLDGRRVATTVARVLPAALASAVAAALAAWGIRELTGDPGAFGVQVLEVAAGVVAGVLVFTGCALMFGIREVDEVKDAVLRRFRG